MKISRFLALAVAAASLLGSARLQAQANLIQNPQFTGANPLAGWRISFPYEAIYKGNDQCVKVVPSPGGGGNCAQVELTADLAANNGGKIETAFLKVEPGATYHAQVESYATGGLAPKLFAEVWAVNPRPTVPPTKYEVPAQDGLPALVNVYRAPLPDPAPGENSWKVSARDFTVPSKVTVAGQETQPSYITIKAFSNFSMTAGKVYFRNFQLLKKGSTH